MAFQMTLLKNWRSICFSKTVIAKNYTVSNIIGTLQSFVINEVGGLTRASYNGFLITDGGMAERLKATVC